MPGKQDKSRGSSASPNGEKGTAQNGANGGVKLPAGGKKHPNGVTNIVGAEVPSLSGNAASFKPVNGKPAPISFLNRNSTADEGDAPVIVSSQAATAPTTDKGKGKAVQQPIGTRGANYSPTRPRVWFTTDVGPNSNAPGGHYVKLKNLTGKQVCDTMKLLDDSYGWNSKVTGNHCPTPSDGSVHTAVYLRFDDIRDAALAFEQVEAVDPNLQLVYVSQTEYAAAKKETENGTPDLTSYYDGQVIFMCEFRGLSKEFAASAEGLEDRIHELARESGEVLGISETEGEGGKLHFRVEYYKISVAKSVVVKLTKENPKLIGKWAVTTKELPPLSVQLAPAANMHYLQGTVDGVATPPNGLGGGGDIHYTSPTGRTAWKLDAAGNQIPVPPPTQVPRCKTGGGPSNTAAPQPRTQSEPLPQAPAGYYVREYQTHRSGSYPGPANHPRPAGPTHHPRQQYGRVNHIPDGPTKIYPHKILNGTDVRTSIMLRNIPNEMDFQTLKNILDEQHFGRYDFSYLRIDFNNNKNVGYGFVNFLDPADILPFYYRFYGKPWLPNARHNRRWGPRIADISYACIQGLDCLVEKMRNSSVMDENKDFRPKVWWTIETAPTPAMIGTEKAFPEVNNPSKKQRSRDNATQIGLYSNGGRNKRNNHGNGQHHSQFDRGTTAQIQEEAYFNNQAGPMQDGYPVADPNYMLVPGPVVPPQMFPPMMPANVNGFEQYVDSYGNPVVADPMAYGQVQFTDPFNGGYSQAVQGPGFAPPTSFRPNVYVHPHRRGQGSMDLNGAVVSPTGPAHNFWRYPGHHSMELPKAIAEEGEEAGYAGVNGSVNDNGYPNMNGGAYQPHMGPQY